MTPNHGFRYLLEQLPIVGNFVVAQIADNNKSLTYTIFSNTSMTSTKSLSFVWCFIRGLLKIPSISALLTHIQFSCTYYKPSPFHFMALIKFSLIKAYRVVGVLLFSVHPEMNHLYNALYPGLQCGHSATSQGQLLVCLSFLCKKQNSFA